MPLHDLRPRTNVHAAPHDPEASVLKSFSRMRDRTRGFSRSPADHPYARVPIMRRHMRRVWLWMLLAVVLMLAIHAAHWTVRPRPVWLYWLASGASFLIPAAFIMWSLGVNRFRRRIMEWDGNVCPHCAYNLDPRIESGDCPECGEPFTLTDVRQLWTAALDMNRLRWSNRRTP